MIGLLIYHNNVNLHERHNFGNVALKLHVVNIKSTVNVKHQDTRLRSRGRAKHLYESVFLISSFVQKPLLLVYGWLNADLCYKALVNGGKTGKAFYEYSPFTLTALRYTDDNFKISHIQFVIRLCNFNKKI